MAQQKLVPTFIFLLFLCAIVVVNVYAEKKNEDNFEIIGSVSPRKIDVDRQGGIGSSLLSGPMALGLATLLLSIPILPALLIAPLAFNGIGPAIGAVGDFMSSMGGTGAGESSNTASILQSLLSASGGPGNINSRPSASGATSGSSSIEPDTAASEGFSSIAQNALKGISDMIFNRRTHRPMPGQQFADANSKPQPTVPPQSRFGSIMSSLRDVYSIFKSGLRRYEITDSECQSRIICEVHQKAVGRSFRSITSKLLDMIGIESQLEKSDSFSGRAKSVIKEFVHAAKTGLSNNDCALVYYRCPTNAAEPNIIGGGFINPKPIQNHDIKIFNTNQMTYQKPVRTAVKTSFFTTPRTVHYYSNINKL